jgi:antitoxin component YwqK of YwqJK toxin-antitoxin module
MNKEFYILVSDLEYSLDPYLPSWEGKLFTGVAYEQDEFGTIISEKNYKNGKEDGYIKRYNFDGKIINSGFYKNGEAYGLWQWFYKNGAQEKIEIYNLHNLVLIKEWNLHGVLVYRKYNNHFSGIISHVYSKEQFFNSNGHLIKECLNETNLLIEKKVWDKEGVLVNHTTIDKSSSDYNYWKEWKAKITIENTFTFSK